MRYGNKKGWGESPQSDCVMSAWCDGSRRLFEIYVTQKIRARGWEWKRDELQNKQRFSVFLKYNKRKYLRVPIQVCVWERHTHALHLFALSRHTYTLTIIVLTLHNRWQERHLNHLRGLKRKGIWVTLNCWSAGIFRHTHTISGAHKKREHPAGGSCREKNALLMSMGRLAGDQRKATGTWIITDYNHNGTQNTTCLTARCT